MPKETEDFEQTYEALEKENFPDAGGESDSLRT